MIGEIVVLTEDYEFNKLYKKGHQFTIVGVSYRGWDIKDSGGNCIYETLLIQDKFIKLSEWREDQIDNILK